MGLGKKAKATAHSVRNAAGTAVRFTKPRGIRELVFALPEVESVSAGLVRARRDRRRLLRRLRPRHLPQRPQRPQREVIHPRRARRRPGLQSRPRFNEGVIIGESQNFTRSLVNEPGNKLTPTILGQRAAKWHGSRPGLRSPLDRQTATS